MLKAYKYRLYPTKEQARLIASAIELCRYLYNCGLEQRIRAYKQAGVQLSAYDQINELPDLKEDFPEYKEIHSQVLQDVLRRLDIRLSKTSSGGQKRERRSPVFPGIKGRAGTIPSPTLNRGKSIYLTVAECIFPKSAWLKSSTTGL